jgi:hypothetical protein
LRGTIKVPSTATPVVAIVAHRVNALCSAQRNAVHSLQRCRCNGVDAAAEHGRASGAQQANEIAVNVHFNRRAIGCV